MKKLSKKLQNEITETLLFLNHWTIQAIKKDGEGDAKGKAFAEERVKECKAQIAKLNKQNE